MNIWLRLDGYAATEIAPHSPPTWETLADGGTGEISWEFSLTIRSQHQFVRPGALVEVMCGPFPVATGLLGDVDRVTWACSAYGLFASANDYQALDGSLAATRNLGDAIAHAIGDGWPARNLVPVTGTAAGDATGNPVGVGQLLDDYAVQTGQRWGVDPQRVVYMKPDPTAPTWLAAPDSSVFGTTNEGRAGKLYGRYLDSATGLYATAQAGSGSPQESLDLSARGALTGVAATAILQGALDRDKSRTAWTNGVTLGREQLQTIGGTPAFLPAVRAGQMMRSFGLSYGVQALALDTLISKTRYTAGDDSIYVEPVNTAPRTVADVIAAS